MFVIGIDLASAPKGDFAAVGVVGSAAGPTSDGGGKRAHKCIHLDRWRAPYPKTIERVAALANVPALRKAVLVVDQTGAGRPVVDALRAALPGRRVVGVTFTAGTKPTKGEHRDDWRVPKALLVSTLRVLLGEGRVKVSRELEHFRTVQNELLAFHVKRTEAGNDTYGAARERDHDDLVAALMLACWLGESVSGPPTDDQVRNWVYLPDPASARSVEGRDGKSAAAGEYARHRAEALAEDFPDLFGERD